MSRRGISTICFITALAVVAQARSEGQPDGKTLTFRQDTELREGRRVGIMASEWFYCHEASGEIYRIPRGYITDYTSTPWFADLTGIDQFGTHKEAALIHDWLYSVGEEGRRLHADRVFRDELQRAGVPLAQRRAMYRAVRVGGNKAYGSVEEWEQRFFDFSTGKVGAPPFPRPEKAAVDVIEGCTGWVGQIPELREQNGAP